MARVTARSWGAGNQAAAGYYTGAEPAGASRLGGAVGAGQFAQGQGVSIGQSTWHPTILYLFALVIAEMAVFGFVARMIK